jgi:hypothetical protein
VIQSYRRRYNQAPGDPVLQPIEDRLAAQPPITVPTIVLDGACNEVSLPQSSEAHARFLTGPYQRRVKGPTMACCELPPENETIG